MSKISVYIIAYNEVEKVKATIESVRWADEVVLVDSWSSDGTPELASSLGARVVQVDFKGFGDLRNQAIAACSHEWIFSLDADERCTEEVAQEIHRIMSDPSSADIYRVPRRNFFMGRWIKHSGWYPNYRQPQLFRKGLMGYDQKAVHEGYLVNSSKPIGHLKNAIWQFPFKNMSEVMQKANRYSTLGAQRIAERRLSMGIALSHGIWAFVKHYLFKLGFLDGWAGFVIALQSFEGTFYRYVKAIEIQKGKKWQEQKPGN
ncbi:MAG: alpha-L-glycero-D-manno-heptose beta-1,4-glucosyltransferase [Betaproteobacteria bacterium HGW-Betaproteobacteria-18]|nr:MAG: alpha-L-glycero-D-manno-heptose beta-1,4-glucosyltransferase [Betaproteobacteria bacterium HGW-Betaproteobacteria-18]